ncbi:MAG TPA: molybdate ABC transporter substrate-binding protein [Bryobacteraceae bacterium]|jgi:molybdate transport system substrate-binding protein|nr:molybdate ABC transporter substrate-binding protein [Bryobacteraceae bacterium]
MRVLALAALISFGLAGAQTAKREVAVAAAANLNAVFKTLGPQFEAETGIHPVFSFASTAQLAAQIDNGAPFDVFTAADTEHVDALVKKSRIVPGSRAVYATGILALWIPPRSAATVSKPADIAQPAVKVIALAKPELAPYGLAARQTLQKLGVWKQVEPRIVYADNINMAKQYGSSGNADVVFTAYSLVLKEGGKVIPVDEKLHSPIEQALGIVAASKNQNAAKTFTTWLLTGRGRDGLRAFGYKVGR